MSSQLKRLCQLLYEERLGYSTLLQFLRRLQYLAEEGNLEDLVYHIFLQCLPAKYFNILVAEGEEVPIEKLADDMADLVSQSTALILSMQTPERVTSLDRILEGIKELEVRMSSVRELCGQKIDIAFK